MFGLYPIGKKYHRLQIQRIIQNRNRQQLHCLFFLPREVANIFSQKSHI